MHIVHCIARLNDGGPARVLLALGTQLCARGHRLTVLAGTPGPDEPDLAHRLREAGMVVETVPGLGRRMNPFNDVRALVWLLARVRHLQPDLVHTHTAKAGALGRLVSWWLGLPCLHTYHGHVLHGYFSHGVSLLVRHVERVLAGPHHHHGLTMGQVNELCYRAHIGRPRRWHCLSVPVSGVVRRQAEWHARLLPNVPVIGFLGRCAAIKDAGLWLETLAVIAKQRVVQGVVCGDGDQRAALESQAIRLGVRVHFTGFVPAAEALGAMDVLLVTSRTEGQPLVVSEAGWAGVPVVAPPVGGLIDLIAAGAAQGAARTPADLARACLAMLDPAQAEARARLLVRARAHAESLAPECLVSRYEACYRAVLH